MIAVQKPPAFFSPSPAHMHRPNHSRHPSAPVVIRSTLTPGLLAIAKPVQQQQLKQQQAQQYQRAPRQSPRGKNQRSPQPAPAQPQPVEDDKKPSPTKPRAAASSDKTSKSVTVVPSPEKSARGRQPSKPASKDRTDCSAPAPRAHVRRPHQPSPTRIPQQTESSANPSVNPFRAQSFVSRDEDANLYDPFLSNSSSDNEVSESTPTANDGGKSLALRAPPQLSSRPTGKLARRRQSGQAENSTPSKPIPAGRKGHKQSSISLSQSVPAATFVTPQRPATRRVSTDVLPVADWDDFPIRDDVTVINSSPSHVRESMSVPPKRSSVTWQQSLIDDAPRTAPLSASFSYAFPPTTSYTTPPPAHRRRSHHRVPSEGVFAMSTDEDSSDSSDELRNAVNQLTLTSKHRASPRRTPPPSDSAPASFYAGSIWQNSPSPDELPVPAFRA